jgi:hypothetical protein
MLKYDGVNVHTLIWVTSWPLVLVNDISAVQLQVNICSADSKILETV